MVDIAPWDVGAYMGELAKTTSIATRNQHLSALRHFFDAMVTRHAIVLNPALSVRGERYATIEGRTPEISIAQARTLLASVNTSHVVGLRDRAILAALIYTSSRAGAGRVSTTAGSARSAGISWSGSRFNTARKRNPDSASGKKRNKTTSTKIAIPASGCPPAQEACSGGNRWAGVRSLSIGF